MMEMKHRIVHALQKYLLNPPIQLLFAVGIAPPGYAILETIGCKTGKARRTPVGDARIGYQFWIVAEHGMKAGYVRNLVRHPRVRLNPREGQRWLAGQLPSSVANATVVRLFGTQLLTVRIDLDG